MFKKNPYKFTIQFNHLDPRQRQAAELLNSKNARGKALIITNALLDGSQVEFPFTKNKTNEKMNETVAEQIASALEMFE